MRALLAAALVLLAGSAAAQQPPLPASTSFERIRQSGWVRIGFRENTVPFSFMATGANQPQGYSIDLCREIAAELATTMGKPLQVEYRRVTPTDRLEQVLSGRVDLECGSTTITDERNSRVSFSPVIFAAGTRLLVQRGSNIHSMRDLDGKTVVGVAGTTNARAMFALGAGRVKNLRITTADSYEQALALLGTGAVDAVAADDILMAGLLMERGLRTQYLMVGDPLTFDPYGIAYARDDLDLASAVEKTFARLATSGQLRAIYRKWFLDPLPSGERLGLPMNAALEQSFRALGMPAE